MSFHNDIKQEKEKESVKELSDYKIFTDGRKRREYMQTPHTSSDMSVLTTDCVFPSFLLSQY